jgi:sulfite reductase alpha subunit-like flavoprotein
MLVLFGSQTGNSEDVSERIVREGQAMGMDACALPMDCVPDPKQLALEPVLVFVCSTTGVTRAKNTFITPGTERGIQDMHLQLMPYWCTERAAASTSLELPGSKN